MQAPDQPGRETARTHRLISADLVIVCIVSLAAVVLTLLDASSAIRIPFAVPFVLFCPGYCLVALLFPGNVGIDRLERIALSFGLSMALVAPVALGIDQLPWGITRATILSGLSVVILGLAYLAAVRRRNRSPEDRFTPLPAGVSIPRIGTLSTRSSMTVAVAVLIVGIAGIWKAVEFQMTPDPYTEFTMLSAEGTALNLPRDLRVGDVASVTLSIANHELTDRTYFVTTEGAATAEPITITLGSGDAWSGLVSFQVLDTTSSAPVVFALRRSGLDPEAGAPYRTLELWITVREGTPVAHASDFVAIRVGLP